MSFLVTVLLHSISLGCEDLTWKQSSTFHCSLITAEFAAAVILISFGVYMGKVSRLQLLVISVIEVVMYAVNEFIVLEELKVADAGGSIIVHIFACYFGMAITFVLRRPEDTKNNPKEVVVYHSDLFAMIGRYSTSISLAVRS